ncbi:MAG TPA: response regulator transcription factor [Cellvibrio sp.]|nr:response regulator transcription factor [Cellvibrio sp.]
MKTALIIEDNIAVAKNFTKFLMIVFAGIKVHHASTLAEARRLLVDIDPDLVFLDIGLPDGKGTNLLLDGTFTTNNLVVITTIFDDDLHLFDALRLGAQGYLLKDNIDANFIAALEGIVAGRPPLSPSIAQRIIASFRPNIADNLLSPREIELLTLVAQGKSVRSAADTLGVTQNTAAGYMKTIYQKLQVNSRAEVTRKAIELGLK